jgi:hypothetical protein
MLKIIAASLMIMLMVSASFALENNNMEKIPFPKIIEFMNANLK